VPVAQTTESAARTAGREYSARFSRVACLASLWKTAQAGRQASADQVHTRKTFQATQRAFWRLVNNGTGEDARAARALLTEAGFTLRGRHLAPVMRIDIPVTSAAEITARVRNPAVRARLLDLYRKGQERGRRDTLLRSYVTLSIDHATALTNKPTVALEPFNLRFMLAWDNSVRGDRFTSSDTRVPKESTSSGAQAQKERSP
jgi:hypothetical protein